MQTVPYLSFKWWIGSLAIVFSACNTSPTLEAEDPKPPNILLIISDDQAWTDYSFMDHRHIETPNIDKLAAESLTFTRGYVAAPLCSPSLATISTGLYPHQHGITGNDPLFSYDGKRYTVEWKAEREVYFSRLLERFYDNTLLTQYLEELDYLSLQTGKWWLGSWQDGYFTHGMTHGDYTKGGRHGDDGLTIGREGLQPIYNFIEEADSLDRPFFVWYAPFLPHTPHTPPKALEEKYLEVAPTAAIAKYWAMCEWFDQTCGELMDHLEEKQLAKETLVVYVCDNGWIQQPDQPGRFAARSKQSPYEGGIRTPMMFRWPGKIDPQLDTTTLVSSIDIVPTLLAATGITSKDSLPGKNVLAYQQLQTREYLFAEAFEHDIQSVEAPTQSLKYRVGFNYPWKLIWPDSNNLPEETTALFNIAEDPYEKHNQMEAYPEIASELRGEIERWWPRKE